MRKIRHSLKTVYEYMISLLNQLPSWVTFKPPDRVQCLRLTFFLLG